MPPPWFAASPTSSPSLQPGPDEHEKPFGISEGRSKEKEREAEGEKGAVRVDVSQATRVDSAEHDAHAHGHVQYRMYKRRWMGVCAIIMLNIVAGMSLVWFGPIANNVVEAFGFTLDEVNWLGNVVNFTYLPCAALVPAVYARLGVRRTCYIGAVLLLLSAWIRYAGTARSLSVHGKYALLIIGQIIAGVTQPVFQVLIPGYSERWFDLKGRTTATMLMSIANPIGNAIGQLISPLVETPTQSILVLAIIYSAATPFVFIVLDGPPTPPTHAGEQRSPSFVSFVRAMVGREPKERGTYMTRRERSDFVILALAFGVLVGVINAFSILTAQDFEPYGYSDDISGLFGATILLTGIVAAFITAPLFDRVFTHHLALTCKLLCPFLGGAWLGLIWAVRRNDTGALFTLMAVIGVTSLTMLPVALELAVELTRNADASSAVLWASSNLVGIIFVLVEGALRDGPSADPPYNMHRASIFQGVSVCGVVLLVFFIQGKQLRRDADERAQREEEEEEEEAERGEMREGGVGGVRGRGSLEGWRPRTSERERERTPGEIGVGEADDASEMSRTVTVESMGDARV